MVLVALLGAIAWLRLGGGLGDGGKRNVLSLAAALLGTGIYWVWFVVGSRQRGKLRVMVLCAGLVGLVAVLSVLRIESWSGSLIPKLRWAWREPRESQLPTGTTEAVATVDLTTTSAADFPGFLGPTRTATVPGVNLAKDWSQAPPKLEWRVPCGSGWSGFAVVNEVAITQEQRRGQQVVVARSMADGAELWRHASDGSYYSNLARDGPRATPLVHAGLVYAHDPFGRLVCLDGRTGAVIWQHDLRAMYGLTSEREGELIGFGRAPSPIVHEGRLIIAAGGDPNGKSAGLVAFAATTGELLWEGPPRQLSYASPNVVVLAGRTQIVVTNEASVSGHAPATGELLWEHPWPGASNTEANNSQPTPVGNDRVLLSKGYGQGSALLRLLANEAGSFEVEVVWQSRRALRTKFTNPVVHAAHVYALSEGILECVALESGERVWRGGRYGHGQVLLVGQDAAAVLLVMTEEGRLVMVDPNPEVTNQVLGEVEVFTDKVWNTFALYGDRVVVRNANEAACYRLKLAGG